MTYKIEIIEDNSTTLSLEFNYKINVVYGNSSCGKTYLAEALFSSDNLIFNGTKISNSNILAFFGDSSIQSFISYNEFLAEKNKKKLIDDNNIKILIIDDLNINITDLVELDCCILIFCRKVNIFNYPIQQIIKQDTNKFMLSDYINIEDKTSYFN